MTYSAITVDLSYGPIRERQNLMPRISLIGKSIEGVDSCGLAIVAARRRSHPRWLNGRELASFYSMFIFNREGR
jgi:hypothetical protein